MDYLKTLYQVWPVLTVIAALVAGWGMWVLSQRFVPRAEHSAVKLGIDALSVRVANLESGVAELEGCVRKMPDADTMVKIQLGLEAQRGDMKALRAEINGVHTAVDALKNNTDMLVQHHLGR